MNKDRAALVRQLRRDGWTVRVTKRGHYRATHPTTGRKVTFAATPRTPTSMRAVRADLRRAAEGTTP